MKSLTLYALIRTLITNSPQRFNIMRDVTNKTGNKKRDLRLNPFLFRIF
jgi:hypothetical protein